MGAGSGSAAGSPNAGLGEPNSSDDPELTWARAAEANIKTTAPKNATYFIAYPPTRHC